MKSHGSGSLDQLSKNARAIPQLIPYDSVQEEPLSPLVSQSGVFRDFFTQRSLRSTMSEPPPSVKQLDDGSEKLLALEKQLKEMQVQEEQQKKIREHPAGKILMNVGTKKAKSVLNELYQQFGNQLWPCEQKVEVKSTLGKSYCECVFSITELAIPGCDVINNVTFIVSEPSKIEAIDTVACTVLCWLQDEGYLPAGNYSAVWRAKKADVQPEKRKPEEGRSASTALPATSTHVRMVHDDYEVIELVEEQLDVEKLQLPRDGVLESLEAKLGYRFGKKNLLRQACHHASCGVVNWKKLCTLGAAALNYIVVFLLDENHPELEPNMLTTRKNEILKREKFVEFANQLGLQNYMVVQYKFALRQPSAAMLVEMFEAIVGAIDRDGGPHQSRGFIKMLLRQ